MNTYIVTVIVGAVLVGLTLGWLLRFSSRSVSPIDRRRRIMGLILAPLPLVIVAIMFLSGVFLFGFLLAFALMNFTFIISSPQATK